MKKIRLALLLILIVVPFVLLYRAFFLPSPLSFGDAPFFYQENLKELFNIPFTWNFRNDNFGASQFHILWLYLPTFLYGLLNHYLGVGNDFLIRIVFYFPSTILAILGAYIFVGKFQTYFWGKLLGSILYGFNAYFLLLLDGGQVGVALAYGLFPWAALTLYQYLKKSSVGNFLKSLTTLFLLTNVDLRISLVAIVFGMIVYLLNEKLVYRNAASFSLLIISLTFVNAFWLIPLIFYPSVLPISGADLGNSPITLLDSFLLYQPHFPLNEFGKLSPPPFYFGIIPILLFLPLLLKGSKKLFTVFSFLFLSFIFLTKGVNPPLGEIYHLFIEKLPWGVAFRDSSKFYIPLLLTASVLIAISVNSLNHFFKGKKLIFVVLVIYFYFLLLIHPAILPGLSGALAGKNQLAEFKKISQVIKEEDGFLRTLWFPEKPTLAFNNFQKETLSANRLYLEKPFALQTSGNYDLFNFLHSPQLTDWFRLLGIHYVFFPQSQRNKSLTKIEEMERKQFVDFVGTIKDLQPLNLDVGFPTFSVSESLPKIFTQEKALIVVGDGDIYQKLKEIYQDFHIYNQGFLFAEDGLSSPQNLISLPKESAYLIFNQRDSNDLALALKQYLFIDSPVKSQWGHYENSKYLDLKNELLKNNIKSYDLGFNKGIYFSNVTGEKLEYKINIPESGTYRLALRTIANEKSSGIKVSFKGDKDIKNVNLFKWNILGPFNLEKGTETLSIENKGGFNAVNIVSLLPEQDYEEAQKVSQEIIDKFEKVDLSSKEDLVGKLSKLKYEKINFQIENPTRYSVNFPGNQKWIVFSDHYNFDWIIEEADTNHFPLYSMINGFWVNENSNEKLNLIYTPQKNIPQYIKISLFSAVLILLISLAVKFWKR